LAKRRAPPAPAVTVPGPAAPEEPKPRTRIFWWVLTGIFLAGLASTVLGLWALSNLYSGGLWLLWVPVGLLGLAGMIYCMLLTLGVLYRVDRLRGNLVRRIELFE
jgi:hypothetical protein